VCRDDAFGVEVIAENSLDEGSSVLEEKASRRADMGEPGAVSQRKASVKPSVRPVSSLQRKMRGTTQVRQVKGNRARGGGAQKKD
jgi:hypothetical protein